MSNKRALGVVRLSRTADPASTSIERQREIIEAKAADLGLDLADRWSEDKATSAFKVPPTERKQLRVWLEERADEWDVALYWRQDRLVRRPEDFMALVAWCKLHGKQLMSATESLGDVTQHAGVLLGFLNAWQAEGDSLGTSARVTNSQEKLRRMARWTGGKPPYGWKPAPLPAGGWTLVPDERAVEIVREMVRRVLAGESVNAICGDLNRRRVPSPLDHWRIARGRPPTDRSPWRPRTIRVDILRSRSILGEVTYDGEVVRGDDGMPLRFAEPLISPEDWRAVQDKLAEAGRTKARTVGASFGRGVAFCGMPGCGAPLRRQVNVVKGIRYDYYVCDRKAHAAAVLRPCEARNIRADYLDGVINESVTDFYGHERHGTRRVTRPGQDRADRLAAIGQAMADLTVDQFVRGNPRDNYDERMARLRETHAMLSAQADGPATVTWEPSKETVGEHWARMTPDERRLFLVRHGVKVYARREPDGFVVVRVEGGELEEMREALGARPAAQLDDMLAGLGPPRPMPPLPAEEREAVKAAVIAAAAEGKLRGRIATFGRASAR